MHIAFIDIKKLSNAGLTAEPNTNEVVLTSERRQHILEHRGIEFYNEFIDCFADILTDPDFIYDDKRENTVLYVKRYYGLKNVNIVVKIAVPGDNPAYKNSIITVIGERNKTFRRSIRNRRLVYSKTGLNPLDTDE